MDKAHRKTVSFICGITGNLGLRLHLASGSRMFSVDAK